MTDTPPTDATIPVICGEQRPDGTHRLYVPQEMLEEALARAEKAVNSPVLVTLPLHLTPEMIRAVRLHPTTCTEDKDEEHRRIGWLLCAWDVLVEHRVRIEAGDSA